MYWFPNSIDDLNNVSIQAMQIGKGDKIFLYYLISQMLLNAAGSKHGHQ